MSIIYSYLTLKHYFKTFTVNPNFFFKRLNFICLIFIYLCIYKHSLFKVTGISAYCGLLRQIRKVFSVTGELCCNSQQWDFCRHRGRSKLLPSTGLADRPHIPFIKSYFYSRKKFQPVCLSSTMWRGIRIITQYLYLPSTIPAIDENM